MSEAQVIATAARRAWGKIGAIGSRAATVSMDEMPSNSRRASGSPLCQHWSVKRSHIAEFIGAAVVAAMALPTAPTAPAHAAPCPDAEVVFARGTAEDPGLGPTGEAFVDALRTQISPKSLGVYAVDYPATTDFPTAVQGISDARAHILATAASCPLTQMVLGGFSQGAAVAGFVTANAVPDGVSPTDVPAPMPPDIANHVAAVALFGKPSNRFMHVINDPPITIGPQYLARTIDLCENNDLVCDPQGHSFSVHNQYVDDGMPDQAATFVARQLHTAWAAQTVVPPAGGPAPGPQAPVLPLALSLPGAPVAPAPPAAGSAVPAPHLPSAPTLPGPAAAPLA